MFATKYYYGNTPDFYLIVPGVKEKGCVFCLITNLFTYCPSS